jgi:hypothetical protein
VAGLWIATVARSKTGRWSFVACLLVLFGLVPFLFPSLFPSELRSRGQEMAQAWLARDVEQLKTFADPTLVESVPLWVEATQPPDLTEDRGKPVIEVAVERNDGDSAEVLIQIKGTKKNGTPGHYVYRHRWVLRKGIWYVQPELPAPGSGTSGKGGRGR